MKTQLIDLADPAAVAAASDERFEASRAADPWDSLAYEHACARMTDVQLEKSIAATPLVRDRASKAKKIGDNINHPQHYTTGDIECIDAIAAATEGLLGMDAVCTANAMKYLWRWKHKGGHDDLRKARWYINRVLGDY